jgi:isorenieratene synthase
VHSYRYVRRDFPGFHVGKHATRPSWETERDTLYLAGDWVVLPFPAMLMEAAYSAGLLAANAICKRAGVREYPMWTVPLRGFMAGWPKRPF